MKKKVLIGAVTVLVVLLGALSALGSTPVEISTEIEIEAPPEEVWEVLVKVDAWPAWNKTVAKASGNASLGSELDLTMFANDGVSDGPRYKPVIVKLDPPALLEWRATMISGFVFTNDKVLELKQTATGTKLIHIERFSGMLVPLFGGKMQDGVPPILNTLNTSVKALVEKQ